VHKFDSYVICTSPRSGSTLLCNLLAATAVAGNPASYFHRPSISAWLREFELVSESSWSERQVLERIFSAAIDKGSLNTGMFGVRVQRSSFEFLAQKLAVLYPEHSSDLRRFQAAFGRTAFIHLTRLNKIEQAVSYVRAEQTGLWHVASDGTELERQSAPGESTYDPGAIKAVVDEVTIYDNQWKSWFVEENIVPLSVTYESLSDCPNETLRQMLDYLGLDTEAASGIVPGVAKLADKINGIWVERFRCEDNLT